MAKQVINFGTTINDGTGDSLRNGAQKINSNFTEIYELLGGSESISIVTKITAGPGLVASSPTGDITIRTLPASDTQPGSVTIGSGIDVDDAGLISVTPYTLPRAATNILGGIKVGDNLTINNDGVLSAISTPYSLPTASPSVKGGVKVGTGLEIIDGVLNVITSEIASALQDGTATVSLIEVPGQTYGILQSNFGITLNSQGTINSTNVSWTDDLETTTALSQVKVNASGITIEYQDTEAETTVSWNFGTDGKLTTPGSLEIYDEGGFNAISSTSGLQIDNTSLDQLRIIWNAGENQLPDFPNADVRSAGINAGVTGLSIEIIDEADDSKTWSFRSNGILQLPAAGDIVDYLGNSVLGGGGSSDRLVNGDNEVILDAQGTLIVNGTIYSASNMSVESITDTSITAGTDLKLYSSGLFALRNYSTTDGIAISTQYNSADERNWLFGTDGGLTFPDGQSIIRSLNVTDGIPGLTLFAPERIYLGITSSSTSWSWDFRNYGQNDYSTDKKPAVMLPGGSVIEEDLTNQELNNGMAGPLSISSRDKLTLRTNNLDDSLTPEATYDWVFGKDGSLTFPDNTVQTTAYNITNQSDDNSTILAVGSTMTRDLLKVQITVANSTEVVVEFNYANPEASVTISGNNGTTNFFNGPTTVLSGNVIYYPITTAPLTQVGDMVTAVIADHTFHKMYRITAMYRDVPDETTIASVYCTIEQLM
jgi:hypothetical protein